MLSKSLREVLSMIRPAELKSSNNFKLVSTPKFLIIKTLHTFQFLLVNSLSEDVIFTKLRTYRRVHSFILQKY